jgi:hypothetical protein
MEIQKSYSDFISTVTSKPLQYQHSEQSDSWLLWAVEAGITYTSIIGKPTANWGGIDHAQEAENLADYLSNYAANANKPVQPKVVAEPSNTFQMQADAVSAEITKGTTATIDFKIQNYGNETYSTKYLAGAEIYVSNAALGDYAESQIIDIDNLLGYGANTVLKTYVRKKYLFDSQLQSIIASAPGAIPVGLYIRVVYHSVGTVTDPKIFINYDIEIRG